MSLARLHADWLRLIEISGPFLSMPVLQRIFPQGLDAHDSERLRRLRAAFEEWQDNQGGIAPDPEIHQEWVRFVLHETLGWDPDELGESLICSGEELGLSDPPDPAGAGFFPDLAIVNPPGTPEGGSPRVLIRILNPDQPLEKRLSKTDPNITPALAMADMLRAHGVKLGLLTNGEQWMLVHAPVGETSSFISWYAPIWLEEPITLRAFCSLLGPRLLFGVPDEDCLEALFAESAVNQQDLILQLGYQVRTAVEVLIRSLDQEDKTQNRRLLADMDPKTLYSAALTVMMRLVFLFSAEERKLIRIAEDPIYLAHYSMSTLREQLQKEADRYGEEILEYRRDAWFRLMATCRAVYGGVRHDRLWLIAYGGHLFDPDRYPFLEGRPEGSSWRDTPADPLPVNNRTVLHLLSALQIIREKAPGAGPVQARRLSFRALGIEQIGHVYESLLDHTAIRAEQTMLGLHGAKDQECELSLSQLEALREKGEKPLVDFLKKQTKRSVSALKKALAGPGEVDNDRLLVACDSDPALKDRVLPFANLLRTDTLGYPVVITAGSLFVTQGTDRRTTGTHYTPPGLTEPVVRHTLEPLVYHGPAQGSPPAQWRLKSAREILALKVCDMAMGSGAFLVQTCRYLAQRLTEAWNAAEAAAPNGEQVKTPEGDLTGGDGEEYPLPADPEERYAIALRVVAERCLYGVDKNPMAVEMAKLSLWLVTLSRDKPFTFLDHALKCGDSLLGVDANRLINWSATDTQAQGYRPLKKQIDAAIRLRKSLKSCRTLDISDLRRKEAIHQDAETRIQRLKLAGDLIVAPFLMSGTKGQKEEKRRLFYSFFTAFELKDQDAELQAQADAILGGHTPFHWPLEFPEVFLNGKQEGFDAVVGNPPFQGGQRITGTLGKSYRAYLVESLAKSKKGSADLCAYFFLRAFELLKDPGNLALIATNTIAQGNTREVGLDQIAEKGGTIFRALPSRKWPGTANLEVAMVWLRKGDWAGPSYLADQAAEGITPYLAAPGAVVGNPYRLKANEGKSFQGSIVLGMGFILTPEEARALIEKDGKNQDVLFPYLNGQDLNTHPEQNPGRWVINFFDWPLDRGAEGSWQSASKAEKKEWIKAGRVPKDYPYPVAADYPDCLRIVEEKVKPERINQNDKYGKIYWWRFLRIREELYEKIKNMEHSLIRSRVSNINSWGFFRKGTIASEATVIVASDKFSVFAIMQNSFQSDWIIKYASTMRTDVRYTPSDCFETFPFPESPDNPTLETIGKKYYEYRQSLMKKREEGLTKTYNRFHDPEETASDIQELRALHAEMDQAVAAAYGWDDLALDHDFHETRQGVRYTLSESARQEVLDRLLRLNHERYQQELAQGLHDTGKSGKKSASQSRKKGQTQKSIEDSN